MPEIGIVVIGRNEGERLRRSLESLGSAHPVVYVDSGSSDGSAALARAMGAEVVELDAARPFSAARARNEGFSRMLVRARNVKYVQFIDGDCELAADWLEQAQAELEQNKDLAVVCGRRRERFPQSSIYNRLCDMEWNTPIGEAKSCGGDSMIRVEAFSEVGGFDASVIAGEEPELCLRLRQRGWKIRRIDAEMTLHDAAMTRFGQWWRRAVRGGHGAYDVARRFEKGSGPFSRQVQSAITWGLCWPGMVIALALCGLEVWGWRASIPAAVLGTLVYSCQIARIAIARYIASKSISNAFTYACFIMIAKWAQLQGVCRYLRDQGKGQPMKLIEYKQGSCREAQVVKAP